MFSLLRRPARVVAALGLGAAVVAGSTTVAIAAGSSPSTSQVLTACAGRAGWLRLVTSGAHCRRGETAVQWDVQGPVGATGPTGPAGPTGATGPAGPPGASAPSNVPGQQVVGQLTVTPASGTLTSTATDLYSFTNELDQPVSISSQSGGTGAGKGRLTTPGATMTVPVGPLLTELMTYEATGTHYRTATVQLYKPGTTTVVGTYEMYAVVVTSIVMSNDGSATSSPHATVTVDYEGFKATVPPSSPGGVASTAQWNLVYNNSDVSNL